MRGKLKGTVVLLTGASSGIGRAAALSLANKGATVGLVARRVQKLEEVAASIRDAGGIAQPFPSDVAVPGAMECVIQSCTRHFGRLDVLINNAGEGFFASIEQTSDEDIDRILAVNFKSVVYGVRAVLPVMRQQGRGHIINIASTAGRRGSPYVGVYCASKSAVVGMTESLRVELLGSGIDVSLVCPGATRTEFFDVACRRTELHRGLVGPVESPEQVAAKLVKLIEHPRPEVVSQALRRKIFLILNIVAPSLIDRVLSKIIGSSEALGIQKCTLRRDESISRQQAFSSDESRRSLGRKDDTE